MNTEEQAQKILEEAIASSNNHTQFGRFCPYKELLFCQEVAGCPDCQIYLIKEGLWAKSI